MEQFRSTIIQMAPFLRDRMTELREWGDMKLLTVRVDRLRRVSSRPAVYWRWARSGTTPVPKLKPRKFYKTFDISLLIRYPNPQSRQKSLNRFGAKSV